MGKAENFLEFITATLHSLSLVPFSESLLHSPHVNMWTYILLEPSRGPSTSLEGFREFPEKLFRIIVLTFATFFNFVLYILTITAHGLRFRSFPIIANSLFLLLIARYIVKVFVRILPSVIVSLIPSFALLRAVSEGTELVA